MQKKREVPVQKLQPSRRAATNSADAGYVECPVCRALMLRGAIYGHAWRRHQLERGEIRELLSQTDGKQFNLKIRPVLTRPRKPPEDPGKYGNSAAPARFVRGGAPGNGTRR